MGTSSKMLLFAAILGVASCQQIQQQQQPGRFPAYSPGGGPSYRAIPRLVGLKVGEPVEVIREDDDEYLVGAEGRNIRVTARPPFSYDSGSGAVLPVGGGASQYAQAAPPLSYAYVQQPGETLPLIKRIRASPSPYANYAAAASPTSYAATSPYAHNGGVQYAQTIPAVATYRSAPQPHHQIHQQQQQQQQRHVPTYTQPAQYRPVAYAPQQPQYYQAQAPAPAVVSLPRQKVVQVAPRPLLKVQKPLVGKGGEVDENDEYPSDPNPQYNFAFDVKDDDLTNYQNRQETRDGGVVKGSYSVVDPDGYVRTVTYEATSKGGFQAKVTREPTDVKIKFPVPTPAPQEGQKPAQQLYQYAPTTSNYVPRRYPHRLAPQQYPQQQ